MSFTNLPVALVLLGLLILRSLLSAEGKQATRLLSVALLVGIAAFTAAGLLFLIKDYTTRHGLQLVTEGLTVLFFVLLALHYTNRKLPLMPFWLPLSILCLAILTTGVLVLTDPRFDTPAYTELTRTLLLLSATLAVVTINRSPDMLNTQPVFWIPSLLVATAFTFAAGVKVIATLLHFGGSGFAGLLSIISSLLALLATVLLLTFLGANIDWFRRTT